MEAVTYGVVCVLIMQNCLIQLTMKLMKLPDLFGYI